MRLRVGRRRQDEGGLDPQGREAIRAALADPLSDLAGCRVPESALKRRLWHWRLGSPIGALTKHSREEERLADPDQLVALAAIQAEAGLLTQAVELADHALSRDRDVLEHIRYVGLIASLHAMAPDRFGRYAGEADAAGSLRRTYGTFRRLVEARSDSICVVGNAPTENGRARGPEIDSHAIVIRFNNYSTHPRYWADYGHKTDIWIRGSHFRNVWRRTEERFAHVIIADDIYWRVPNGQNALVDSALFGHRFEDAPRRILSELVARLGATPSSGLIMLYWLAHILGSLDRVSVYGFSLTDQTQGLRHYYADKRVSKAPHDWVAEREIFDELVAPKG